MAALIMCDLNEGDALPDSAFPKTINGHVWPLHPATAISYLAVSIDGGAFTELALDTLPFFTYNWQLSQAGAAGAAHRFTIRARNDIFATCDKDILYIRPPTATTTTSTTSTTTSTTTTAPPPARP